VFGTLALLLVVVGLIWPTLLRPVFISAMVVTFPLGWLVSHLLLLALFFGLFTPLALVFRIFGRDALALRMRPEYKTYWTDKPAALGVRSYFRQS
jgi:hypothetical protein